jgi:hypothetical protein
MVLRTCLRNVTSWVVMALRRPLSSVMAACPPPHTHTRTAFMVKTGFRRRTSRASLFTLPPCARQPAPRDALALFMVHLTTMQLAVPLHILILRL